MMIKTPSYIKPQFSCHESLQWLHQYTISYFKENSIESQFIWQVDDSSSLFNQKIPEDVIIDIILTGSFFLRFLELPYWPVRRFRLWCFNPDIPKILSNIIGSESDSIGIIPHPRYSKNNSQIKNLVYAGRLSHGKNVEALIALASYLQHSSHPELTLTLFGENSQIPEESWGRVSAAPFSIDKVIKDYDWITPPRISGFDAQWMDHINNFDHYISLSTSMYEDFAVSPTMASAAGLNLILSNWGGHKYKNAKTLLPHHLIFRPFDPPWLKDQKTKSLAKHIYDETQSEIQIHKRSKVFEQSHISSLTNKFIKSQFPEILYCFREATDVYADTIKGKKFFEAYKSFFGPNLSIKTIIIYDNMINSSSPSDECLYIHNEELYDSFIIKKLITAKSIYLSCEDIKSRERLDHLGIDYHLL